MKRSSDPPNRIPAPGTPTSYRTAKEPDGFTTDVVKPGNVYREAEVVHRTREPVDVYKQHFTQEELWAAGMFYKDWRASMVVMATTNYDGMPRAIPGPRAGGVADEQREAHIRFGEVLRRLTPGDKHAMLTLVIGLHNERTGRTATIQDLAKERGVRYGDAAGLAKVGVGLLKAALEHTYEAYRTHAQSRAKNFRTGDSSRSRLAPG